MPLSPFGYEKNGSVIVCTDGAELLIHHGETEAPTWRKTLPGRIVDVATTATLVLALDELGHLGVFNARDGSPGAPSPDGSGVRPMAQGPLAFDVATNSCHAVISTQQGVLMLEWNGSPPSLFFQGAASCVAVGVNDSMVALGVGNAVMVLTSAGAHAAQAQLPGQVTSVCWHPNGYVLASVGSAIYSVDLQGGAQLVDQDSEGRLLSSVTTSFDGKLVAARAGDKVVQVWRGEGPAPNHGAPYTVVSQVVYERPVGELCFGPGRWLGVGLQGGDGNKINLASGAVHRTDTHPGRQHNSWILMPSFASDIDDPTGSAAGPGPSASGSAIPPTASRPAASGASYAALAAAQVVGTGKPAGPLSGGSTTGGPAAAGPGGGPGGGPGKGKGKGKGKKGGKSSKAPLIAVLSIVGLALLVGGAFAIRALVSDSDDAQARSDDMRRRIRDSIRNALSKTGSGTGLPSGAAGSGKGSAAGGPGAAGIAGGSGGNGKGSGGSFGSYNPDEPNDRGGRGGGRVREPRGGRRGGGGGGGGGTPKGPGNMFRDL